MVVMVAAVVAVVVLIVVVWGIQRGRRQPQTRAQHRTFKGGGSTSTLMTDEGNPVL
jgi:hypothetical protein